MVTADSPEAQRKTKMPQAQPQAQAQAEESLTAAVSTELVKGLIRMTVYQVAYLREILPEECFKSVKLPGLNGLQVQMLNPISPDSLSLQGWVEEGVMDALNKRYLQALRFGITEDGSACNSVEEVQLCFDYSSSGIVSLSIEQPCDGRQDSKGSKFSAKSSVDSIKSQTLTLIRKLIVICQTLSELPEERHIYMKLVYTDDCPAEYQPKHFSSYSEDQTQPQLPKAFSPGNSTELNASLGQFATEYHSVTLALKSGLEPGSSHDNVLHQSSPTPAGASRDRNSMLSEEDRRQMLSKTTLENTDDVARLSAISGPGNPMVSLPLAIADTYITPPSAVPNVDPQPEICEASTQQNLESVTAGPANNNVEAKADTAFPETAQQQSLLLGSTAALAEPLAGLYHTVTASSPAIVNESQELQADIDDPCGAGSLDVIADTPETPSDVDDKIPDAKQQQVVRQSLPPQTKSCSPHLWTSTLQTTTARNMDVEAADAPAGDAERIRKEIIMTEKARKFCLDTHKEVSVAILAEELGATQEEVTGALVTLIEEGLLEDVSHYEHDPPAEHRLFRVALVWDDYEYLPPGMPDSLETSAGGSGGVPSPVPSHRRTSASHVAHCEPSELGPDTFPNAGTPPPSGTEPGTPHELKTYTPSEDATQPPSSCDMTLPPSSRATESTLPPSAGAAAEHQDVRYRLVLEPPCHAAPPAIASGNGHEVPVPAVRPPPDSAWHSCVPGPSDPISLTTTQQSLSQVSVDLTARLAEQQPDECYDLSGTGKEEAHHLDTHGTQQAGTQVLSLNLTETDDIPDIYESFTQPGLSVALQTAVTTSQPKELSQRHGNPRPAQNGGAQAGGPQHGLSHEAAASAAEGRRPPRHQPGSPRQVREPKRMCTRSQSQHLHQSAVSGRIIVPPKRFTPSGPFARLGVK